MPIPYVRDAVEPVGPDRPRMQRPREGRRIAGVCAGLAVQLGLPVRWVRLAVLALGIAGGAGIAAYVFLWALTPESREGAVADDEPMDLSGGPILVIGGIVALGGALLWLQNVGLDVRAGVLIPALVIVVGVVLAWSQLDGAQRGRWLGRGALSRRATVVRFGVGILLAVVGLVILMTRGRSLAAVWDAVLATAAVLVGAVLIAAPWVVRLWTDFRAEQVAAARATERADIAAHLHDSVLQTLALIQRTADDPAKVGQLARAQERELRSWLYGGPSGSDDTLAAAAAAAAHEVEDLHGVPVDLVVTGDRPMDPDGSALVRAFREALLNAVRHGSPPVTAYVEIGTAGVEAYVRDRGAGFDLEAVPGDRLGVRESVLGRMERHGGTATVTRLEQGTEVALTLPPTQRPAEDRP